MVRWWKTVGKGSGAAARLAGCDDPDRWHPTAQALGRDAGTRRADIDISVCPLCGGTLRVIANVTDPNVIQAILAHLKQRLGKNRWSLQNVDGVFEQAGPQSGRNFNFTTTDTAGSSCEQIVEAATIGQNHLRRGCSTSVILDWINRP